VTITAQNTVTISDPFGGDPGIPVISATATGSLADASPVTITGQSVNLLNGTINASTFLNNVSSLASPSNAGLIEIRGNSVNLSQFTMRSGNLNGDVSTGKGGSILIRGAENLLSDSIQLTASTVDASSITTGGGGSIEFQTMALTISDGSILQTSSFARGAGGSITVRGAETVTIESGSHIDTDTIGNASSEDSFGTAGDILLQTQNLALLSGGQLNARALPLSTGSAGNIIVQGISGSAQSVLIDGSGSGIFTDTQGTGQRQYCDPFRRRDAFGNNLGYGKRRRHSSKWFGNKLVGLRDYQYLELSWGGISRQHNPKCYSANYGCRLLPQHRYGRWNRTRREYLTKSTDNPS
jgi:hypothetical protein